MKGSDGVAYHKWSDDPGTTWFEWTSQGGDFFGLTNAVLPEARRLVVVGNSVNDSLYHLELVRDRRY
jgi:hypothetical protein